MHFNEYTGFGVTADWKVFGNARKVAGKIDLNGVASTIIRANDFSPVMPVVEYPAASGKYVAEPSDPGLSPDYLYDFPSADFGNMHKAMMQAIAISVVGSGQSFFVYPRAGSSYFFIREWARFTLARHGMYKYVDSILVVKDGDSYIGPNGTWWYWSWAVLNKYFFNNSLDTFDMDSGFQEFNNSYDPIVVNPGTPQGKIEPGAGNEADVCYFRSPGKEFEDTINPGVLQLWPVKSGYVLPYNAAEQYVIISSDWVTQHYASGGCLRLNALLPYEPEGHYLCTVTFDGNTDITSPPYFGIGINETQFSMSDGVAIGGYALFPDNPDTPPKRIGAVTDSEISFVEDMSGVLSTGNRIEVYTVPAFIIESAYPINESTPTWIPIPMSNDLVDWYDPANNIFVADAEMTFGIYLNNFADPSINIECTGINIINNSLVYLAGEYFDMPHSPIHAVNATAQEIQAICARILAG